MPSHFSKNEPIFSDIETQGLYINTRLLQLYQPSTDADTIYLIDFAPIGYKKSNRLVLLQEAKGFITQHYTVWYNASYDLGTLNVAPKKLDDMFYAVKSAYPQFQQFKLDTVISKMGYSHYYSGLDKTKLQKAGFVLGAYLSQEQLKYSAIDVLVLAEIYKNAKVQEVLKKNLAYKVDIQTLKDSLVYQQNGLIVDNDTRLKYLEDARQRVEKYTGLLPQGFNPNSYIQVRKYLNTDKSDHDSLVDYATSDRPLAIHAEYIIEAKKAKKQVGYLESIAFERMYTKFNPAGAITGRFTSSGGDLPQGFNAQQIPRDYQGLFNADTEDTAVVHLDYSTLELRVACAMFGLSSMYKRFKNDEDIHKATALSVTGKKFSPEWIKRWETNDEYVTAIDRQNAKAVNFGFVFGMGAERFKEYAYTNYGLTLSLEECQSIRATYFREYPEAGVYHKKIWNAVNSGSYIYQTALGRKVCPRTGTDAINGPVQGSGAEATKLSATLLVKDYPIALKYIFNVVHDAIYMRVPKEEKQMWEDILRKYMLLGWEEVSKSNLFIYKDIPIKAE